LSVKKVADNVWNLTPEGMSSCYLVVGSERALLIDTGLGHVKLRPLIAEITDLPVTVVNTHGHGDHVGGNSEFSEFYISPQDIPTMDCDSANALPVKEGDKFDLGDRVLEVIDLPGHTPGSIALFDRKNRIIFTGDTLSKNPVFFIPGMSDGEAYLRSMEKLEAMKDEIDTIIAFHGESVLDTSMIGLFKNAMKAYLAGELTGVKQSMGPREMNVYMTKDGVGFISPAK